MNSKRYSGKVIIVGTGAGGATAAVVLANAGVDTLIFEQGRHYEPSDHGDILTGMRQMYLHGGMTLTLGNPPILIPLGCAVGGTTIINSSTCFRPPREKVDQWEGPSWDALEPRLQDIETRLHVAPADESLLGGNYTVLKRGCDKLGIPIRPLQHNLDGCKGSGRCAFGCPTGAKQSTDRTFIPDALASGARLYAEHTITGVIRKGNRLIGLKGKCPSGTFEAYADVVILSMGALITPAFLLRHRLTVGPSRVGRGLRIHPAYRIAAEFDEVVDGHIGLPQGAYIDHWADRGILLEGISMPPGPLLSALPGAGSQFKELAAHWRQIATFGIMISDTSAGRVFRGIGERPFTALYQLNQADTESMRFGMVRLGELYFAAGAKTLYTNALPYPVIHSLDELRKFEMGPIKPSGLELMAFHPTGTCAMGVDKRTGVVNAALQSHDIPNLYIMDGSVIPCALGVNPQITIMALAWHGAAQLAATLTN